MRFVVALLVLVVAGAGCSDSPDAGPASAPTVQVQATSAQATAEPEMVLNGKAYPVPYFQCAQRVWDGRVAQWNALPAADRDRVAGGSAAWMQAKGWPVTFEDTLEAPATRKACPE